MNELTGNSRVGKAAAPPILLVSENYPPVVGGSSRWVGRIARHWPATVSVVAAQKRGLPREEQVDGAWILRARFDFPSWAPDTLASSVSYVRLVAQVVRIVRARRPQVIICGRGVPEGVVARIAGSLTGVPYVCLVHGEEVTICGASGSLKRLLAWAYGGAALVVANSRNSAALAQSAGAAPERCAVVPPGVDAAAGPAPAEILAARERFGLTGKVILSVGRLEARKNHVAVVRALPILLKAGHKVTYVVAGDGESRAAIAAAARDQGVADRVRLLGLVSDANLAALYRAADVFALPGIQTGRTFEGFGMVFLEAATAGVPSIAGKAGGSAEAVLDGQTGLVVNGADQAEVRHALQTLLADDRLRARMGEAARRRACAEFDWPVVVGDMVRVVSERLGFRGRT